MVQNKCGGVGSFQARKAAHCMYIHAAWGETLHPEFCPAKVFFNSMHLVWRCKSSLPLSVSSKKGATRMTSLRPALLHAASENEFLEHEACGPWPRLAQDVNHN